jgi:hypothetical protein
VVYLIWKNGKKTKHETAVIYKKCPQKVIAVLGLTPAPRVSANADEQTDAAIL